MRVKQLLAVFLLAVSLCFVPALGYGKVRQWRETDIDFYLDKYPEEPRRGLYEWQMANNEQWQLEMYKTLSGVDLLNLFRAQLEVMYQFLFTEIAGRMNIPISLKTDIVGKFHSGGGIPLGYFYQGEYHLWEK